MNIQMAEKMNKIVDPYGILNAETEETKEKWRKRIELFEKYGSEMLHEYGLEGLEKMDNEPKCIEGPKEEARDARIMPSTSNATSIAYWVNFLKKKNRTRVGG